MGSKMCAKFYSEIILADKAAQTTAVTLTNTGDISITFCKGQEIKTKEAPNGIDIMIPIGSGKEALCTKENIDDITVCANTPGWNVQKAETADNADNAAYWMVYAERDITLEPGDSINIGFSSVTPNGADGAVTVTFLFHTFSAWGEFEAVLKKNLSPEIICLSVCALPSDNAFISPETAAGEQSEGFIIMPYVWPPPDYPDPPGPTPPPPPKKLLRVTWKTENAFSCTLLHNSDSYEVSAAGEKDLFEKQGNNTFTLTAYGENKIGSAVRTVEYPK